MNQSTKTGLLVLGSALLSGLLGDALLRTIPWGVNVFLWICGLAVGLLILARQAPTPLAGREHVALFPMVLFASGFAWRGSATLALLNTLMLAAALCLTVLFVRFGKWRLAGVADHLGNFFRLGLQTMFGPFLVVFQDIEWKTIPRDGWNRRGLGIARGAILALPLLLVFGALLVSADAVFAAAVRKVINVPIDQIVIHGFVIGFTAWISVGPLRNLLLAGNRNQPVQAESEFLKIGLTEIATVLVSINALFLSFVAFQFRYLFGGSSVVEATVGLSFAEYARRGFFELVAVSTLVLPLLLFLHWALKKDDPKNERFFNWAAGVQILLLFVMMFSAFKRMRMYQLEYGMTELRFYTTVFMAWLAVVFVWFGLTVLRGRRPEFVFGAVVSAAVFVVALNVVNPDARIVRANVAHALAKNRFDAGYAVSLSADAVPVLVENIDALPPEARRTVARRLLDRWFDRDPDWRSWSWANHQAWKSVHDDSAKLCALACEPEPLR